MIQGNSKEKLIDWFQKRAQSIVSGLNNKQDFNGLFKDHKEH